MTNETYNDTPLMQRTPDLYEIRAELARLVVEGTPCNLGDQVGAKTLDNVARLTKYDIMSIKSN